MLKSKSQIQTAVILLISAIVFLIGIIFKLVQQEYDIELYVSILLIVCLFICAYVVIKKSREKNIKNNK